MVEWSYRESLSLKALARHMGVEVDLSDDWAVYRREPGRAPLAELVKNAAGYKLYSPGHSPIYDLTSFSAAFGYLERRLRTASSAAAVVHIPVSDPSPKKGLFRW